MFGDSFIKRASAWYLDGAVIKPRTSGTSLEYDGSADIAGQYQGALLNNQMVQKATFDILGLMTDPRFLNLQCEDPGAGTLYDASGQGHAGTYQGSMTTGDRVKKGMGWALDLDGTDDHVDLGDSDDFSFGDGSNDEAVTWAGVFEVVDTAGNQTIMSKWDETVVLPLREWRIYLIDTEALRIMQFDESENKQSFRTTNAGLSVGWHSFVITSPGDGGATVMNNVKIYIDGALVASTANNDAGYVAMENLASKCWVGAIQNTSSDPYLFMTGDSALTLMDGSEWSAFDAHRAHELFKGLYRL